jgi:hypothetical protein
MSDFGAKRFDSRILDREESGAAFERFVDEFLRLEAPGETLVRGLARGADGAIDLADADQRLERIVECKFIGSDTNSTAAERWNEVKRNLEANLLAIAKGDENRRRRYRPRLKSEGNLKTYTFVTSSICASADERNQLRKAIAEFLAAQSKLHDELSHLGHVTVDLRYWDDLIGKNASFAPLFYRWFGGFPQGYGEIELSFGSESGFKQFLASRNLPYFSRDLYLSETGQNPVSQFDSVVQFLTQGNDARTHVIFGPGGVGKTRLSIEICQKAEQAGWWPIRVDRKASVSDLDSICRSQADAAKLLLFIDYAEAFEELDHLPEAVARLASDGMHRLSILASTRSSSLQKVIDRLNDLHPEVTDLSRQKAQDGYADWVVRKIIDHFSIPKSDEIARTCKGLPVMGAFAGFLFQRDRKQFDLQFGNLAAVKNFGDWASVRLKILEDRFPAQPVQALLADLVVRLPMPQHEVHAFRANTGLHRDIFDILKADRWIEEEGEAYSAAHDVLADAILARHLSAMPRVEQDRVQDIALAALRENRLDRCMAAFDRLGEHPVFEKLSGKALVEALMAYDNERTLAVLPSLIKSRLLHPAELIALLASSDVVRARLAQLPQAHLTLARAAEWATKKGQTVIDRATAELALNAPLRSAVAFQHPSNMVLRCAHAFDPERFQNDVIERLLTAPVALDSHYLIVSLLKWRTPPNDASPYLVSWLAENSTAIKASFVYKAWLDAKGEVDAVREKLLLWLAEHGTTAEAQFVYNSWLDAKGEVDAVREKLLLWVAEHGTTPEAQFVYNSWLKSGQPLEPIKTACEAWLLEHWNSEDAVYVTKELSKALNLSYDTVCCILAWAGTYPANEDAIFRLSRLSRVFHMHARSAKFSLLVTKATAAVLADLFAMQEHSKGVRDACSILFANFSKSEYPRDGNWSAIIDLYCDSLRHGSIFWYFDGMPRATWEIMLHEALALEKLDPIADAAAVRHAHELILQLRSPDEYAALLANGYLTPLP